jgi:tetratricopeptide (TPR) repeat protein
MRPFCTLIAIVACAISGGLSILAANEEPEAVEGDSSAGLPEQYAKNYLIASSTISPDKKFAVIYPKESEEVSSTEDEKDYLVKLEPFSVLGALDTPEPYHENQSHGGISAKWSDDSSAALVTLDGKWGPRDVLLLELRDGKLKRTTKLLSKVANLLYPNLRKYKRFNDIGSRLIFTDFEVSIQGTKSTNISSSATTNPGLREPPDQPVWDGEVEAIWDIRQAKFTSKIVSGQMRKVKTETQSRAEDLRYAGMTKQDNGDLDGAIADFTRAIELDPKDADAYYSRGDARAKKKQYDAALKDTQKAIELNSKDGHYYSSLAWYQLFNRKPREAIAASLKALKLSPADAVVIKTNLAHSYLFDNQFDKAKAIYLEYKDSKLRDDERTFSQAVLDDFKELEEAGVTHPDMEKIKALLPAETEAR